MDRLIYTALSGARGLVDRQAIVANNLANINTDGFRADIAQAMPAVVQGPGLPTRVAMVEGAPGTDFSGGPIIQTGRSLDVAIQGQGWFAVQASDGDEAYTRAGALQIGPDGTLQESNGLPILSTSGSPIAIPPDTSISIGTDGTVSAIPKQAPLTQPTPLGQIKMVNPDPTTLVKGADGLIRVKGGDSADADPTVTLSSGTLEGSNVNAAQQMVDMISIARQFEMQMKMLQSAQDNAQQAQQLLSAT